MDETAVEMHGGTAAKTDPLGDARARGLVVFAHDVVADSVEMTGINGDTLIGAAGLPATDLLGDETVLGELGSAGGGERSEPSAVRFAHGIRRGVDGAGRVEGEENREEGKRVAAHGRSKRLRELE